MEIKKCNLLEEGTSLSIRDGLATRGWIPTRGIKLARQHLHFLFEFSPRGEAAALEPARLATVSVRNVSGITKSLQYRNVFI